MKTELRYSIIHEVILSHGNVDRAFDLNEYKKLEKKSEKFVKLYNQNIKKIVELLEKKVGSRKWQYEFVPIYIVDINLEKCYLFSGEKKINWKGYGDPITILLRQEKVMLFTLIHELAHNLIDLETQVKMGEEKAENYIHLDVSQYVWDQLNIGDWREYIKK
ncbi:MAG: hypothetical protein V1889_02995 [archaeon]